MRLKLLVFSLLICTSGLAQNFFMEKKLADGYFNSFDFYKAIPFYESLAKRHPNDLALYANLATIYDHLNDSQNAERCYAILVNRKDPKPEFFLNYARALSRNGKYDQALLYYKKYKVAEPGDPRGNTFSEAYQDISTFLRDSAAWKIKKSPFSSLSDDFSPAYFGHSIVFSSDRAGFSMIRSNYNWTQTPFLDLFQADPNTNEVKYFSRELNSVYHEGPMTFSKTQDTIIFTRSNYYHSHLHKSNEGVNKLSLFQANWDAKQKRWVQVTPLSLNSDEYSVEHPALSPDGKELYFASDMPGGLGGMDIYVSQRITDAQGVKSWGKPVNLGPKINTPGYEVFPFVDGQGNLWYASNGIPGLGGLDIFFAGKSKEGYLSPINPGYPLNTRFDDFGYITDSTGEKGYFSSDRNNHYGNDDIYSITRFFKHLVVLVVDARTKEPLPSSHLNVLAEGEVTKSIDNVAAKPVMLTLNPFKSYEFKGEKEKYKSAEIALTREQLQKTDTLKIPLIKVGPVFKLIGKVVSAVNQAPVPNVRLALVNESAATDMVVASDKNGLFTGDLLPETDYLIRSENETGSKCSAELRSLSTKGVVKDSTFQITVPLFCEGDIIRLGDIYYDLNKYNIRLDAAIILDKLLKIMNDYPKMKIELRSHTDSRASAPYNMKLSDNRAKSAAAYLFSKGIAKDRIVGKGYGETMLINKCTDGVPCSEAEHQINRRTEFKILKLE